MDNKEKQKPFLKVYYSILADENLKLSEKIVLSYLLSWAKTMKTTKVKMTNSYMAKVLEISESKIKRIKVRLRDAGLLDWELVPFQKGPQKICCYNLNFEAITKRFFKDNNNNKKFI